MLSSIIKFNNRISLPKHLDFKLKNAQINDNKEILNNFNKHRNGRPILELYHASRFGSTAVNFILKDGFKLSFGGNKGNGIYLANHGRYSIWAGYPYHVIICHVIADQDYVKRFKSEIKSDTWDSEFLVSNPNLIYPRYIINYELENKNADNKNADNKNDWSWLRYVDKNEWNCKNEKCIIKQRCDCEQYPLFLKDDIVDIDY
ncbi:putative orfan [Tupanvirus soda lake]|uniref:Orfan n=2 Tax=Tupanvirus TaxID=2094720 RepID=A0AC62ABG3_9VIRU|nr:putative orfan [Tupanvirus soda lake]QKU34943.1 putative orfan [Tupanvirus soda lake]